MFKAIRDKGDSLSGAALADKIVGRAIAMLCLYARLASVYADMASQGALDLLKEQGIDVTSKRIVPNILNYDGTDFCPFEKLAQSTTSPSQLFLTLGSLFSEVNE